MRQEKRLKDEAKAKGEGQVSQQLAARTHAI
jgi:hypothetical protein